MTSARPYPGGPSGRALLPPPLVSRLILPTLVLLFGGCGRAGNGLDGGGPWQAAIDTVGSTVTVRTLEGSVWGGRARLVETASIGAETGEEYELLGQVRGVAATGERIYVLDWQVPIVRVYDHTGGFVRNIGRQGGGPGEYRDPVAIGVDEAGDRLYIRDMSGGLIHMFSLAGEYLETLRVRLGGAYSSFTKMMRIGLRGDLYLFGILYIPESRSPDRVHQRYVMLGTRPNGAVFDTLSVPWYDFPVLQIQGSGLKPRVNVPFSPDKDWNLTPAGAMIGGVSDSYSFEIRHRDGRTLMIERAVAPVPVQPEESRWHFETLSAQMRLTDPGWIWRGPSIPDRKPAYETFIPDRSGRIWVLRKGPGMNHGDSGEWRDTYLFDVFEEQTGRYLGEVGVPPGVRFEPEPFIRDDLFIASCFDESGVPCVKGYRIVRPHRR